MKFSVITAAIPPQLDGIGDYCASLCRELVKTHSVQILTATENPDPIEDISISTVFNAADPASVRSIVDPIVTYRPDWVLVQYNPFSYGKWGWNPYLVPALRKIRRSLPGVRIAVMAHESFVPIINAKFAIMAAWQRVLFWRLGRNSDILFLSIEPWAKRFQKWFPAIPVRHLPVGGSLQLVAITRAEARERLGFKPDNFVVGLFGTAHMSRPVDWVSDAVRRLHEVDPETVFMYIGPNVDDYRTGIGDAAPARMDGAATAEEVSRRFSAMDLYLCPYTDGVSTRRSSFMVGLQHGIPTVSTSGFHTDTILLDHNEDAYLLTPTAHDAFVTGVESLYHDKQRRYQMGHAAQKLYNEKFDWKPICDQMCRDITAVSNNNPTGATK